MRNRDELFYILHNSLVVPATESEWRDWNGTMSPIAEDFSDLMEVKTTFVGSEGILFRTIVKDNEVIAHDIRTYSMKDAKEAHEDMRRAYLNGKDFRSVLEGL